MRVGYTLWFCVKCSACVQKYMSTVWIDVRGWFCPSVPSSHSIPPSSYHRIIYTRTYFLSFLILSSEIPQIPILIVLHPNDDVLKTLMVGNQLLAGRPDPYHAIPYHTRPRPCHTILYQTQTMPYHTIPDPDQCLSADDRKVPSSTSNRLRAGLSVPRDSVSICDYLEIQSC